MCALFLGSCDANKVPLDRKAYLAPYHLDGLTVGKVTFRDDDRTTWRSFRQESASQVSELQQFLHNAGFMPRGVIDGVYDYVTQASVRLFQEYVRTLDPNGDPSMVPDGVVGNGTNAHITRWKQQRTVCEWGRASSQQPSQEYSNWIRLMEKSKTHYINNPGPIMKFVNTMSNTGSTVKAKDWDFSTDQIHLIGIRRKQDSSQSGNRTIDDFFALLVNGMVFKFWGSTDPSIDMAGRADEPFLVEGQHIYRFGWHQMTKEGKCYRAMKPHPWNGPVVLRDRDNNNALTEADLGSGGRNLLQLNAGINIHWTGVGNFNHSAGCQVIAGGSYINNRDQVIDCSAFASASYGGLNSASKKTKGAYNVLADLIVCYSKPDVKGIRYTLGREESLDLDPNFGKRYAIDNLKRMNPRTV